MYKHLDKTVWIKMTVKCVKLSTRLLKNITMLIAFKKEKNITAIHVLFFKPYPLMNIANEDAIAHLFICLIEAT